MTVVGYPVKRPPRPCGREQKKFNAFRFAVQLAHGTRLDELARDLPHLDSTGRDYDDDAPRRPGRRPDFPPEVYLLFATLMGYTKLSGRDVEAILQDPFLWGPIRAGFASRFPQYKGFKERIDGPSRSQFDYWQSKMREGHLLALAVVHRQIEHAAHQATAMGMFDPDRTDLSHPHIADMFIGDGTIARAMFNAAPGDLQLNELTGELEQIRFDADARRQIRRSEDDLQITDTSGTHYGVIHATTGFPNENVMLAAFHVPSGPGWSEAKVALEYLDLLAGLLPGAKGALWDKAMHGKEIDVAYQMGLMLNARVSDAPGGGPKDRLIETAEVRKRTEVVGTLNISAVGGAAHARVEVGRNLEDVRLEPVKILKRRNPGSRERTWRWFREYRVPDDPRIARTLRGGLVRVRLDTTDEDRKRGINRAENLRPIAEGDDLWQDVGGPRSRAESLFSKTKHKWPNKRIPAVGISNQMIRLIGFGIGLNAEAALRYEHRTGHALDPPPPTLAAA